MSFINNGMNFGSQHVNMITARDGVFASFHISGGGDIPDGEYEVIVRNRITHEIPKSFDAQHPVNIILNSGKTGSVHVVSGNVTVNGSVSDNITVTSGSVTVNGNIHGNVSVVCGQVIRR